MDLLRLLGFDIEQQNHVVQKIKEFMCKNAHKTILDLVSCGMMQELMDKWCNLSIGLDEWPHLDQVKMVTRSLFAFDIKGFFVYDCFNPI